MTLVLTAVEAVRPALAGVTTAWVGAGFGLGGVALGARLAYAWTVRSAGVAARHDAYARLLTFVDSVTEAMRKRASCREQEQTATTEIGKIEEAQKRGVQHLVPGESLETWQGRQTAAFNGWDSANKKIDAAVDDYFAARSVVLLLAAKRSPLN